MNPLYNPNNNMIEQLKNQAMQLKNSIANPQQQVQQLLNSGQMSQQWFNQNFAVAQQLGKQMFG
jgi:hypothetical protein